MVFFYILTTESMTRMAIRERERESEVWGGGGGGNGQTEG